MKKFITKIAAISIIGLLSAVTNASTLNATDLVETGTKLIKVKEVMPSYPEAARSNKVEGSVTVSYDINQEGVPQNIEVIKFDGSKRFIRSSVKALKDSRFQPVVSNGKAVNVVGLQKHYDFVLAEEKAQVIPGLIAFNL